MATTKVLLNTESTELAMLQSQVPAASFSSGTTRSTDAKVARPELGWIENLWAMGDGRQDAVIKIDPQLPKITGTDLSSLIRGGAMIHNVTSQLAFSYLVTADDRWLVLNAGAWVNLLTPSTVGEITSFVLKSISYIYGAGETMQEFDPALLSGDEFASTIDVTLTGITQSTIISACAAVGYMVLVDDDTVYYSAPLNERHFTPGGVGVNAGAGSAKILGISSGITAIKGAEDGFYIYSITNIVKATYSGNPDNPWVFTTVKNSTGVLSVRHTVRNTTFGDTFAWTTSGLAFIEQQEAQYIFPNVTEMLASDKHEEYDSVNKNITLHKLGSNYSVDIYFLAGRYLYISYGVEGELKRYILCYDIVTKEWTRIHYPHLALTAFVRITSGGKTFEEWLETFEDTVDTFADMIDANINHQANTLSIGVLNVAGRLVRLSPIDIKVVEDVTDVLDNVLYYPNIRMSRSSVVNLSKVTLHPGAPVYIKNLTSTGFKTAVYARSELEDNPRQFSRLPSNPNDKIIEYVESIKGNAISLALENIGSTVGLGVDLNNVGRKW